MQIKATAGRHFTSTTGASIKEQIRRVAEDKDAERSLGLSRIAGWGCEIASHWEKQPGGSSKS